MDHSRPGGAIALFARHPTAANLLMVLMIVAGIAGIARLNTQFLPSFTVDWVIVNVPWPGATPEDEAWLPEVGRVLSDKDLARLASREEIARASALCGTGHRVAVGAHTASKYLADYDTLVAREARIGRPRPRAAFEGLIGEVMLCDDPGAHGVLAHLSLDWQRAASQSRAVDTQHGELTLPALDTVRCRTSAWLPLDRPVLLASCTRGVVPCHWILRVARK